MKFQFKIQPFQTEAAEMKATIERQPRKKWELAEEIRRLKIELGGRSNE